MVVLRAASLKKVSALTSEEVRTDAASRPTLRAIEGGKAINRRRRVPKTVANRTRTNHDSWLDVAPGFHLCPSASCDLLIPEEEFEKDVVTCSDGHKTDLDDEYRRELENPGGIALVGLTNTQQGDIAEQVVWDLHDLGKFGLLTRWISQDVYRSPIDMETDINLGVEVRSVSTRARNQAFALTARKKRRMDFYATQKGYAGQVGALVVLDFVAMTADVYLRFMERAVYFERPREPFAAGIPFVNPHAQPVLAATGTDDLPF